MLEGFRVLRRIFYQVIEKQAFFVRSIVKEEMRSYKDGSNCWEISLE
jgi:hypothetical protein